MIGKVARNTLFLSVSQVIARAVAFFYAIFLARSLGVENFGIYTFVLAFTYNFIPVADFGVERLILRDLPRIPEKITFYFSRLLPLRIFLALGSYLAMLILAFIFGQTFKQVFYLAILGLSLIPYSLIYLIAGFRNAKEEMGSYALANVLTTGLTAILGTIFVVAKLSLTWIFVAYLLGNLLVFLVFLVRIPSWGLSLAWVLDKDFWLKILKQSWTFAILTILSVFYLRVSLIIVGLLQNPVATGIYGSAFKFIEAVIVVPQSLALALFPLSARLSIDNPGKLKSLYKNGIGVLFLLSLPFAALLVFLPQLIITFVYGQAYLGAVSVLPVFGLAMILFFVNALPGNIILNSPKVNYFLPVVFFYFLSELILCLILIPRYSLTGAAWAVVGGEFIALIVNNLFVWRVLRE